MTKLMAEFEKQIKEHGEHYWHFDLSDSKKIVDKMTVADADAFLAEILAKIKKKHKNFDYDDVFVRCLDDKGHIGGLCRLCSTEALDDFVTNVLDSESCDLTILRSIALFDNLSLDAIKAILDFDKTQGQIFDSTHDSNAEYTGEGEEPNCRRVSNGALETLVQHKNMTQDFMDTLASESSEGFLHMVAKCTKNPETLLRCAKVAAKAENNNYYATDLCIDNPITTPEMLAEIAVLSEDSAAKVLASRRCPKHLIAEIAKTASGSAARVILQAGKTPAEILEGIIDANDNPEVLMGIAYNRSKKVTPAMLMKAYAKIPKQGYFWIKVKFLKRNDFVDIVSDMTQQVTGLKPTYVEPVDPDDEADGEAEALAS